MDLRNNKKSEADESIFIPQRVSVTQDPRDETDNQIIERQERFLKLSESIKNILVSHETGKLIKKIGDLFELSVLETISIARIIRSYYFGDTKKEEFPDFFMEEFGINQEQAEQLTEKINNLILNKESEGKKNGKINSLMEIIIKEALAKYPEIKEQLISKKPLKIKSSSSPVRPTIENWIKDYREKLGSGGHGLLERGNYLFHSENGKELDYIDRQKVGIILKSLDEGIKLNLDVDNNRVLFKSEEEQEEKKGVVIKNNFKENQKKEIPKPSGNVNKKNQEKEISNPGKKIQEESKEKNEGKGREKGFFSKIFKKEKEDSQIIGGSVKIQGEGKEEENKNGKINQKEGEAQINIEDLPEKKEGVGTDMNSKQKFDFNDDWVSSPYVIKPLSGKNKIPGSRNVKIEGNVVNLKES